MKIYCYKCGENHEFSPLDAERLIYSMQCEISDALTNEQEDNPYYKQFKGADEPAFFCLQSHHDAMGDVEMYGETIAASVEARRAIDGVAACDECGEDLPACDCQQKVVF